MIAAIMPCRGRAAQTLANVRRLLATAGLPYGDAWRLYLVGGAETNSLITDIAREIADDGPSITLASAGAPQLSYWQALALVNARTDAPLLCNLANDLLPGRDWLARGLAAYRARYGDGDGLMGFNDGIHGPDLSPHMLISRRLLDRYGGWPIWYQHNYGDAELCARAHADGMYGKAPWAVLYHDHHITGGAHDAVYAAGDATLARDRALFAQRRERGWTA